MLFTLTPFDWWTLHGLVTVLALLVYIITSHVARQRRQPAAAIAWVFFILLMPYVALPAYLSFGSRKRKRPGLHAVPHALAAPGDGHWVTRTLCALGQPAPATYRDLNLHADGRAAREALLAAIAQARHRIEIATFILKDDLLGTEVIDALCVQARAGVRVRLLLDGLGSLMAGRPRLQRFTDAGGELLLFVPPLHSPLKGRTNLRNHRKLVLVDAGHPQARLWCGGRNLAAEYFEGQPGVPVWCDLSYDLRGALVQQASQLFEHDWAFAGGQAHPAALLPTEPGHTQAARAQWAASGPDQADDTVYALLLTAVYRARQSLSLVTPYFVPDPALLMALCLAARRGVVVDLLLPARSNHGLSDLARNRALRLLVQAGGRVWFWSGMLHAKLVIVDDELALAGSSNLDSRSLFLNYELMLAFQPGEAVQRFQAWFDEHRAQAQPHHPRPAGLVRDVLEGMLLWTGFEL
ncbi:phospholipase D-like domain-containing protein [Curvibacter sp. RS43]|uniref:phospholipase D-like domain-containing protein n=1 Tax=Curvibacter microcysteis TaxID=3026419 RepID=UPI00236179F4|nr:phospholipase D-like domain-containing protein [Curvibacter sp. RS43]MDD0812167.1 phospholipase D-like domain-containing protein [Curvibacter sp. RS43]